MIKWIRNYLLSLLLAKTNSSSYAGWHKVKSVTILGDSKIDGENHFIAALKKRIEKEGKIVSNLLYVPKKRPKENILQNSYYKSDLDIFGRPKKSVFKNMGSDADVLISWGSDDSPNDFFAASSKSSLKIGIGNSLSCYDLVIKDDANNPQKVIDEILKYLKMINHE